MVNDEHQELKSEAKQCLVDEKRPSDEAQDPEEEIKELESYPEVEQSIVPVAQSSSSPYIFEEVRLTEKLLVFRFGHSYIVNASISTILINLERPIEMSNLLVRNNLVTNHASQHILPLIEADSDNLSQPKLFPLCQFNFTIMRVALLVSYLANIWSQLRHIFCDYFGCRNIKPDSGSFQITDSRASEREDRQRCIAGLDDVKLPSLGCLTPRPVSQHWLMDIQCTLSPGIGGTLLVHRRLILSS